MAAVTGLPDTGTRSACEPSTATTARMLCRIGAENLPPDPPPWGNRLRRFPHTPSWGFFPSTEETRRAPAATHQDLKP